MKIKLDDFLEKMPYDAHFEIVIPSADPEIEDKLIWGDKEYCIERIRDNGEIVVERVLSSISHEVTCEPYDFHNEDDDGMVALQFMMPDYMESILADHAFKNGFKSAEEFAAKILKDWIIEKGEIANE